MALMTFDDFRSRISIAEIAESIGYWRNPNGGVSKPSYILGDKNNPQDEIVIYNIDNPAKQTYFNRKGTDKGNLINFVETRLDSFSSYTNEKGLKGVNEVLNKYLNNPQQINRSKLTTTNQTKAKDFNLNYWNLRPLPEGNSYLTNRRKLSPKTIDDFRSRYFIYLAGPNDHVAFPYRTWPAMEIDNLEMRNYFPENMQNYKGFPSGGNRTTSSWLASFVPDNQVTDIYFFESCIDAMSFYEINNFTKETTCAFASSGGTVTQNQITPLMRRFPNAKWHSCMDNDASGNIFDIGLAHYLEGKEFKGYAHKLSETEGKVIHLSLGNEKEITIHEDYFSSTKFLKENNINNLDIIKPGRGKDWNELLIYYKRFDLNLDPSVKVSMALNETLSQLNLHGFHDISITIERNSNKIVERLLKGDQYYVSVPIAETNTYSMLMDCNLRMKYSEFVVEPTNLYVFDNAIAKKHSAQSLYDTLNKEKVSLLKDFHSNDLRQLLEKNTPLSFTKGGVERSFERTVSPSGWGLKEISPLKKNSIDLDHTL
ncbi:toprim domain-containing protein [Bacteroides sp. 51]|uniref:toprim domain-containing protein n=1 Tax=Bacteroides sp. 51 TaxID=2302938 RepID=UPI0013D0BA9C|nr:toprim domain-containing protein [Bacteroides sp. 51]NDV83382.1 hypothetical protein [Bacteroides sp. 51]